MSAATDYRAESEGLGVPRHRVPRYVECRENGCTPRLAAALALRSFPGIKTDSIFNEGRWHRDQFADTPAYGRWVRAQAEAAGVNPVGKYYLSGLADFPGDPTAWVSDRGDVLRVAREKNLSIVDGYVSHRAAEREPVGDVEIADDIVEAEVRDILDADPGVRREDVREQVYALRTGQVDPHEGQVSPSFDAAVESMQGT
jgi:hypothetical protein